MKINRIGKDLMKRKKKNGKEKQEYKEREETETEELKKTIDNTMLIK